jgi:hypothetical protein
LDQGVIDMMLVARSAGVRSASNALALVLTPGPVSTRITTSSADTPWPADPRTESLDGADAAFEVSVELEPVEDRGLPRAAVEQLLDRGRRRHRGANGSARSTGRGVGALHEGQRTELRILDRGQVARSLRSPSKRTPPQLREHLVDEVRGTVRHAPANARRAKSAALARPRDNL